MAAITAVNQYIKKVKALFPFVGKNEKKYLATLQLTVDDYCSAENITALEDLENGFGKAEDIVHEYISSVETNELIRRLNIRKTLKLIAVILLIIITALAIFFAVKSYREYQILKETAVFFEDVIIE